VDRALRGARATLTGGIEQDLLFIDKVIGVGDVALSDHRSTQPTFDEFARLSAEARRGGILSGKAGVVNVHLGDGRRGLALLRRIVEETEIPVSQFLPTHVNRNPALFEEGHCVAKAGASSISPPPPCRLPRGGRGELRAGLRRMLEAGVDASQITFTSDGQGSLPDFDAQGRLRRLEIGRVTSLFAEVATRCSRRGAPGHRAPGGPSNPARILKLKARTARRRRRCDIVLLDPATSRSAASWRRRG